MELPIKRSTAATLRVSHTTERDSLSFEVNMKIMVRSTLLLIGLVILLHLHTMSSGVLVLVISKGKCGDNLIHLEPSVNINTLWATESP